MQSHSSILIALLVTFRSEGFPDPLYGEAARDIVAASIGNQELVPVLHSGIRGRAPYIIRGLRKGRGLTIRGIGPQAAEWLDAHAAALRRALSARLGQAVIESRREEQCRIRIAPELRNFRVRDLVLNVITQDGREVEARRQWVARAKADPANREIAGLAEAALRKDIEAQCRLIGQELDWEEVVLGDVEVKQIRAPATAGPRKLQVLDVFFRANLVLTGPWNVGRLVARGHGEVREADQWRASGPEGESA